MKISKSLVKFLSIILCITMLLPGMSILNVSAHSGNTTFNFKVSSDGECWEDRYGPDNKPTTDTSGDGVLKQKIYNFGGNYNLFNSTYIQLPSKYSYTSMSSADLIQIRVKFQDLSSNSNTVCYVNAASTSSTSNFVYSDRIPVVISSATATDYMVINIPFTSALKALGSTNELRINFDYFGGSGTGYIIYDYIYIGSSSGAPTPTYNINYVLNGGSLTTNRTGKTNNGKIERWNPTSVLNGQTNIHDHWIYIDFPSRTGYTFAGWDVTGMDSSNHVYYSSSTINTSTSTSWSAIQFHEMYNLRASAGTVTFTAKWTPITYSIAYNLNGGTLPSGQNATGKNGTADQQVNPTSTTFDGKSGYSNWIKVENPTKNGFSFAGWTVTGMDSCSHHYWSSSKDNTSTATSWSGVKYSEMYNLRSSSGTVMFTATWIPNKYNVSWSTDGDTLTGTYTNGSVDYGTTIVTPNTPTKTGYTFAGWTPTVPSTVTADGTYTATWTPKKYNVTWITDGDEITGTYTNGATDFGTAIVEPDTPTKTGYTFTGWSPAVDSTVPANDVTYTATWEINKYNVIWKNYDGTVLETDTAVPYGSTPTYDGLTPVRAADVQYTYTFSGWTPDVSEVTREITYTAKYSTTRNKYDITWHNEDGTVIRTDKVEYGRVPTFSGTVPVKERTRLFHYVYAGWTPTTVAVTENADYTIKYTAVQHSFTYTNNGDGTHSQKCTGCDEYAARVSHTFIDAVCICGAKDDAAELAKAKEDAFDSIEQYCLSNVPENIQNYIAFKNAMIELKGYISDADSVAEVNKLEAAIIKYININYIPEIYEINVGNGATVTKSLQLNRSTKYEVATVKIAESDGIKDGNWFVYWVDGDGNIVSTYSTYSFYVVEDRTLTPVYVSPDSYEEERAKAIKATDVVKTTDNGDGTVTLFAEHSVGEGSVLMHGIIYTTDASQKDNLVFGNSSASVKKLSATKSNNQLSGIYRTTVKVDAGNTVYARAYIIDGNGDRTYGEVREIAVSSFETSSINELMLESVEASLEQVESVNPAEADAPIVEEPVVSSNFVIMIMNIINAVVAFVKNIIALF